jgi:isopenicillin N synthase-like dioxygenase
MRLTERIPEDAVERLKNDGFLLIPLTKPACKNVAATFGAAYRFFSAPQDEKNKNILPWELGYRPTGIEYSQSPDRPDPIESFTVDGRADGTPADCKTATARELYKRMLSTFDIFEPIADTLTARLASVLSGKSAGRALRGALRRWSCLQLNYSRPANADAPFINESHEDGHLLTISCANAPGLEIQTAGGDFMPMTTAPDEVLVMPGEIVWLLSGGQIRPLYHRVRREPGCSERLALLFFCDINPRLCRPWVHADINEGVDIGARVLTNAARFGLGGFLLEE